MPKLNHTQYSDYFKHNKITQELKETEKEINQVHFNDPHIQGKAGVVNLSDRFHELRSKLRKTEQAIDRINYILNTYKDYIVDVDLTTVNEANSPDDEITNTMLADISINPFKIKKCNLEDISVMIRDMEDDPISLSSDISLPLPSALDHDLDDYLTNRCLTITVFINDDSYLLGDPFDFDDLE